YLYILRDELAPVRAQIQDPVAEILERYSALVGGGPTSRILILVESPDQYESVVAFSNCRAALLPRVDDTQTSDGCYRPPRRPTTRTFSGKVADWPTRPIFTLDRAVLESQGITVGSS